MKFIKPVFFIGTLLVMLTCIEFAEDFRGRTMLLDEVGFTMEDFNVEVSSVFVNSDGRGFKAEGSDAQRLFNQVVERNRMTISRGRGEDYLFRELMKSEFKINDGRPIYIVSAKSFIGVSVKGEVFTLVRIRL